MSCDALCFGVRRNSKNIPIGPASADTSEGSKWKNRATPLENRDIPSENRDRDSVNSDFSKIFDVFLGYPLSNMRF